MGDEEGSRLPGVGEVNLSLEQWRRSGGGSGALQKSASDVPLGPGPLHPAPQLPAQAGLR